MTRAIILVLLLGSLSINSMGCTYQGRLSMRRVWADRNTLNAPALFYEKLDHFPYHASKVDHFRWMYNRGPSPRVPYQHVPDWALGEQPVIIEEGEIQPRIDFPPSATPDSQTAPELMLPQVSPNQSSRQQSQSVPQPTEPAISIENRLPPLPPLSSPGTKHRLQPVDAPKPRSTKKRLFPFLSRKEPTRPSTMSNQPVGL